MESPKESGDGGCVTVRFIDGVAVVEMDRGENRINYSFIKQLGEALDQVERNPEAKALVTVGKGKFYCNGLDLQWLAWNRQKDPHFSVEFKRRWMGLLKRIVTFPMPTVAVINGHAYAGGANLAMIHDYRTMRVDRGWFCISEVHVGIPLSALTIELLRLKLVPSSTFTDAVIMGRRYTGPEAKRANIVHDISSEEQLIPDSVNLAYRHLPSNGIPRENMRRMKGHLYERALQRAEEDLDSLQEALATKSKL